MNAPWCDLKVAFDMPPDCDPDWLWEAAHTLDLPVGWELIETDGTGARYVAIFRVEIVLLVKDGRQVKQEIERVYGRAIS